MARMRVMVIHLVGGSVIIGYKGEVINDLELTTMGYGVGKQNEGSLRPKAYYLDIGGARDGLQEAKQGDQRTMAWDKYLGRQNDSPQLGFVLISSGVDSILNSCMFPLAILVSSESCTHW